MSDDRLARILQRKLEREEQQKKKEQALREAEFKKKQEEEERKKDSYIEGSLWERDGTGTWRTPTSLSINEIDPVRGHTLQQSGITDDAIDKQVGRERWVKKVNGWQRTFVPLTNNSSSSSKEANTYLSQLTENILPSEVYIALEISEAILREGDDEVIGIILLREATERFFVHSNLSTKKLIFNDIVQASERAISFESPVIHKRYIYICKMLLQISTGLLENMLEYEQDNTNNEIYCKELVKKIEKLQDYLTKLSIFVDNPYDDEVLPSESPLFSLPDEILTQIFMNLSIHDLLAVSSTCKYLIRFFYDKHLYYNLYARTKSEVLTGYKLDVDWRSKYIDYYIRNGYKSNGIKLCVYCNGLFWQSTNTLNSCRAGRGAHQSVRVLEPEAVFNFMLAQHAHK